MAATVIETSAVAVVFPNPSWPGQFRYMVLGGHRHGFRSGNFSSEAEADKAARGKFSLKAVEFGSDPGYLAPPRR